MTKPKPRSQLQSSLSHIAKEKSCEMGKRLRNARLRRGLKISDLSTISSVSESTIKSIEAGDVTVGWGYFLALFQAYGLISEIDVLCSPNRDLLAPNLTHNNHVPSVKFDDDL